MQLTHQLEIFWICYDFRGEFLRGSKGARSLITFGVASSAHKTNKANNIYMLSDSLTQSLNGTTIYNV